MLAVTDDCIDIDEGNSRETLSLAKALVEEVLGHRLLKEVSTDFRWSVRFTPASCAQSSYQ